MDKLRVHLDIQNKNEIFYIKCKIDYSNSDHIMECMDFELNIDQETNEVLLDKTSEKLLRLTMKSDYVELIKEKLRLNKEMLSKEIERFKKSILETSMVVTV